MSMKRKPPTVEASDEVAKKRAPRQDPVSCQSCRKKKLKCDRQQPCSNCQSRRLSCHYAIRNNVVNQQAEFSTSSAPAVSIDRAGALPLVDNVVFPVSRSADNEEHHFSSQATTEHERTTGWLENIVMGPRVPDALPVSIKNRLIATKHAAISSTNLTAFLPQETEALAQFDYYVNSISYLYHVIIPSTVRSQISAIYRSMHEAESSSSATVNLNHLALLFSILATSSYFQNIGANTVTAKQVEKRCYEYVTLVTAALTQSDYINYPTIEGLQAALIVNQFVPNNGQVSSARAMFHMGALVHQCRQMGLFLIDSARSKAYRKKNGFDPVELELKRRLAWSVTSIDWFLGFLGGPQEGSYLVNPAHIAVDIPMNILDEDLIKSIGESDLLSNNTNIPTTMSYFIHRVELSIFCREIVDYTSSERLQGIDIPYSKIMELDQKWKHYYTQKLPDFFRLDSVNRNKYAQLYKQFPQIAMQRLLLQQGYHARLYRLHRGYFIRGARDPAYSYSHIVCLQAARRVIEIKRIMDDEFPNTPSISLTWSVVHQVFMAAIILLMDVCCNWDDILADQRKQEVLEACRMLDRAKKSSVLVGEAIDAMMEVLQSRWRSVTGEQPEQSLREHSPRQQEGEVETELYPEQGRGSNNNIENAPPTNLCTSMDPGNDTPVAMDATTDDTHGLENLWLEFIDNGAMVAASPTEWMGLFSDITDGGPTL